MSEFNLKFLTAYTNYVTYFNGYIYWTFSWRRRKKCFNYSTNSKSFRRWVWSYHWRLLSKASSHWWRNMSFRYSWYSRSGGVFCNARSIYANRWRFPTSICCKQRKVFRRYFSISRTDQKSKGRWRGKILPCNSGQRLH